MVIELQKLNARPCYPKAECIAAEAVAGIIAAAIAATSATTGAIMSSEEAESAANKTRNSIGANRQAAVAEKNNAEEGSLARFKKKTESARKNLIRQSEGLQGSSAVSGRSNAEVVAGQEIINDTFAKMSSDAAASAEESAERVRENANSTIRSLDTEQRNADAQASLAHGNAIVNGMQQTANVAGSLIASNYDHGGTSNSGGVTRGTGSVTKNPNGTSVNSVNSISSSATKKLGTPKFGTQNAEIQKEIRNIYMRGGYKVNQLK